MFAELLLVLSCTEESGMKTRIIFGETQVIKGRNMNVCLHE
ncbi:hypothetical protein D2M30_2384 [Bacillus amyloliquefaciens]|nr:hypothetical protein D2M30_2384 [Bacillus amyloliquefaciens]